MIINNLITLFFIKVSYFKEYLVKKKEIFKKHILNIYIPKLYIIVILLEYKFNLMFLL